MSDGLIEGGTKLNIVGSSKISSSAKSKVQHKTFKNYSKDGSKFKVAKKSAQSRKAMKKLGIDRKLSPEGVRSKFKGYKK